MQLNMLLISSIIGAIGVMTYSNAVPIEVFYTGDTCACPRKLGYEVNMPIPPIPKPNIPAEYDYKIECPLKAKAHYTYSFDFAVEKPVPKIPIPEAKWDLYAKVDRVTAPRKDCYETREYPRTCGCYRCTLGHRYVLPESTAAHYTRSLRHPNSVDNTETLPSVEMPPATHVMAIFFKPLNKKMRKVSKSRNKRDISRIFMRPRRTDKRSDRLVKQYKKSLKDIEAREESFFDGTPKRLRSRAVPHHLRPLKQLSSLLSLPKLRNKRDIKGEYDLIEKDREQMDLTLPEIIQYMPETLDPNFKRNQCDFRQTWKQSRIIESTTTTTTTERSETTTTMATTTEIRRNTTPKTPTTTETSSLKDEDVERQPNSVYKKRDSRHYMIGGCPLVLDSYNPTPNPGFTYEPLTDFEAPTGHPYHLNPEPPQYMNAYYNPYPSVIYGDSPLLGASHADPLVTTISKSQLDHIISSITNKHADFIDASSHPGGALVDPPEEQEAQAKYFLKSLMAGPGDDWSWFVENQHNPQHPRAHTHLRHYRGPDAAFEHPFPFNFF